MDRSLSVAVIGGSLVGPLTALLLQRKGFTDVAVYEALPEAQSRSGGIMGVRFATLDVIESVGIDRRTIVALRDSNVYAYDIAKGGVATVRGTSAFPGLVTSWDALHDKLQSMVDVQYKTRLTGLRDEGPNRQPVLEFQSGEERTADLIVFADGRKSTGREILDPLRTLEYQNYAVWRGLSEPPRPTPSGFNRYYDIAAGRLFSVTGPILQSGKSYWELSHNLPREKWVTLAGGEPEDRAYLVPSRVTEEAHAVIHNAMAHLPQSFRSLVDGAEISGIPVNDTRMPDRAAYQVGNGWAVLLGDALIPVRLQVGAGLNQGLLEGASLADRLSNFNDMYDLMRNWEEASLDIMARWVELARARVGRTNLGFYTPVRPGRTAVSLTGNQWDEPEWVAA